MLDGAGMFQLGKSGKYFNKDPEVLNVRGKNKN